MKILIGICLLLFAVMGGFDLYLKWGKWTETKEEKITRIEKQIVQTKKDIIKDIEDKRMGLHCVCLGCYHVDVVVGVKGVENARAAGYSIASKADNFEHISTKIQAVDETGHHHLTMRYRMGSASVKTAKALIRNEDCDATIHQYE